MSKLEVEILSETLIKPSTPTPHDRRKLHLSLFDQLSPRIYSSGVYYYSGNILAAGDELEKSLSEALVHLYPFAGRFAKHDSTIDCGDQGAVFRRSQVKNCKLSEFLKRAPEEMELVDQLLPWESTPPQVKSETSPQLAVQVNTFEDGGIALGVRISHIFSDGATNSLLMQTWAGIASQRRENENQIFSGFQHEVACVFPAVPRPPVLSLNLNLNSEIIVTKRFQIPAPFLKHGSARAASRVVVALALVWKGLIMAKLGNFPALSIPMNLRGKLCPSLMKKPKQAFGNFYLSVIASLHPDYKARDEVDLIDLIDLLRTRIRDMSAKVSGASKDELVNLFLESRKQVMAKKWNENDDEVYFCSSWYGTIPVYETDFGWGKPVWVSISTQPGPGVCLMESSFGDTAMEVWVSLKKTEMVEFEKCFSNFGSFSKL